MLHAGTALDAKGVLVSAGGRVLDVVAVAPSLAKARQAAYDAVAVIELDGSHHRTDIALRAERGDITIGDATMSALDLPGYAHVYSGKVRDLYAPLGADGEVVAGPAAPRRLEPALRLRLDDVARDPRQGCGADPAVAVVVRPALGPRAQPRRVDRRAGRRGRTCRARAQARMLKVEAIARAYLTGGGLEEYREKGSVSGVALPEGLVDGSKLPEPVFTPTTKAPVGEHDLPMAPDEVEAELAPRSRPRCAPDAGDPGAGQRDRRRARHPHRRHEGGVRGGPTARAGSCSPTRC